MPEIRFPKITANDPKGQLQQLKSYLHQLVEDLNYSLSTVQGGGSVYVQLPGTGAEVPVETKKNNASSFAEIKALIIKSADIINAYYEEINKRLEGQYVAESVFGTYRQDTANDIRANSDGITQIFSNMQSIENSVYAISAELIEAQAWTKSGFLDYDEQGAPIYGFEVGQKTQIDGVETFNRYARFTADGIFFYLPSASAPVAYLNGRKLYITHAEITGSLILGKYELDFSDGIAFIYRGG